MNITLMKYYIYSETGSLLNRVGFSNLIKDYGEPYLVSPNGFYYLFRKNIKPQGKEKWNDMQNQILSIFEMTESKLKFIKDINVIASIDKCYSNQIE